MKKRFTHTQVWPVLRNLEAMAPFTAASRSASSKTMNGALPPSSSETFFRVSAAWRISSLPTLVEPVNDSLRTTLEACNAPPIATASPETMLNTPAGMPACSASTARAKEDNGVSPDGLRIMVQPAASAGPTLRVTIARGKFHGVIAATTPTGSLITTMRESALGDGMTSPYTRLASSPNHSRKLGVHHFTHGFSQWLALFTAEQGRQLTLIGEHQVAPATQANTALLGGQRTPCRQGALCSIDGLIGFFGTATWDVGNAFAARRVVDRIGRAAAEPLAIDVMAGLQERAHATASCRLKLPSAGRATRKMRLPAV